MVCVLDHNFYDRPKLINQADKSNVPPQKTSSVSSVQIKANNKSMNIFIVT